MTIYYKEDGTIDRVRTNACEIDGFTEAPGMDEADATHSVDPDLLRALKGEKATSEDLHAELAAPPVMPPCGHCREGVHSACNHHVIFEHAGETIEDICGCYIFTHDRPRPDGVRA